MITVKEFKEIDSTQDKAYELIKESPHLEFAVCADSQKLGRGRNGNIWISEAGLGLYFTYARELSVPLEKLSGLSLLIGLLLKNTIKDALGDNLKNQEILNKLRNLKLKWPNDLVYVEREDDLKYQKLAGILVETKPIDLASGDSSSFALLVGIGLNIEGKVNLGDKNESVSLEKIFNLEDFQFTMHPNKSLSYSLTSILSSNISKNLDIFLNKGFVHFKDFWLKESFSLKNGLYLKNSNNLFNARIIDLNDDGSLLLKLQDGKELSYFGSEIVI